MKIVHISHLYYPSTGGVQTYFKNISERLVRDYNDDVTVVTTDSYYGPEKTYFKKIGPKEETINGVKVIRFSYRRWHLKPYNFFRRLFRRLGIEMSEELKQQSYGPYSSGMKKYLTNVSADAFFASASNYYFMQLPLWRKCNFFYFASIHLDEDERNNHLLKRQLDSINASTLYIANTQFEKERISKLGVNPEKIFVLGCGVDMAPFATADEIATKQLKSKLGIPGNALIAAYIGRIDKPKSVRLVIEAFEKIYKKSPGSYLLMAGSGSDYVDELKGYCKQLPQEINMRIKWLAEFSQAEKPVLFNCIDLLVLPSKNESFGMVFLEAWSCKKPVIGASIGAVRNVITDNKDGLIAVIDDANDFAEKMLVLLSDSQLRQRLGENGFKKVQENYTWDIIVSRLRSCYLNALGQAR